MTRSVAGRARRRRTPRAARPPTPWASPPTIWPSISCGLIARADVVGDRVAVDLDPSGLEVDLDGRPDAARTGSSCPRSRTPTPPRASRLGAAQRASPAARAPPEIRRPRRESPSNAQVSSVAASSSSAAELHDPLAHRVGGLHHRCSAEARGAAAERAHPARHHIGVAVTDFNRVERHPERVGADLGEHRLDALPDRRRADAARAPGRRRKRRRARTPSARSRSSRRTARRRCPRLRPRRGRPRRQRRIAVVVEVLQRLGHEQRRSRRCRAPPGDRRPRCRSGYGISLDADQVAPPQLERVDARAGARRCRGSARGRSSPRSGPASDRSRPASCW